MPRSKITHADCQSCGACCISPYDYPAYVDLDEEEVDRIPKRLVTHAHNLLSYPAMKTKAARARVRVDGATKTVEAIVCVALQGKPGESCACKIYEDRPRACSQFRPGSSECRASRAELGL